MWIIPPRTVESSDLIPAPERANGAGQAISTCTLFHSPDRL